MEEETTTVAESDTAGIKERLDLMYEVLQCIYENEIKYSEQSNELINGYFEQSFENYTTFSNSIDELKADVKQIGVAELWISMLLGMAIGALLVLIVKKK